MSRACVDNAPHWLGITPTHAKYAGLQAWLETMPKEVQALAAEWSFGAGLRFEDGVYYVCGYTLEGVVVSPLCPQCYGDDAAAEDPRVALLDPVKLRSRIKRHS
jgi:hypothetical protein